MSKTPDILLVGDQARVEQLARQIGPDGRVTPCADPYEALLEMGRRRWAAIVLVMPLSDPAGLCRAARRLQPECRLLAFCNPGQEPQARSLLDGGLDDYFIYPPTRTDLVELHRALTAAAPSAADNGNGAAAGLAAREFALLAESARSPGALEQAVAQIVARRIGRPVRWANADQAPPESQPLLLTAADQPRVLVPDGPLNGLDAASSAVLSAVQQCLPALLASAARTQSLHHLAVTDHLTGTYNRRYFYHLTDQILRQAAERKFRATLLLYDIDDFKHYNDTYGYGAGDEILRETAALMKQTTRAHDVVARIGGDEFAVLFWDAEKPREPGSQPLETAHALADRFCKAVSNHNFRSLGSEASGALTISGGLARFPRDGQNCRDLLRQADEALRAAKKSGKNSIQLVG